VGEKRAQEWTSLLAPEHRASIRDTLEGWLEYTKDQPLRVEPAGAVTHLSFCVLADGPQACAALFERFVKNQRYMLEHVTPADASSHSVTMIDLLELALVAEVSGVSGAEVPEPLQWLRAIAGATSADDTFRKPLLALLGIVLGEPDFVDVFVDDRRNTPFGPGQVWGDDVPALIGYLADAVRERAGISAVMPAWNDFVRRFPALISPSVFAEGDFLAVGRVVFSTLGGVPPAQVAGMLHRQVQALGRAAPRELLLRVEPGHLEALRTWRREGASPRELMNRLAQIYGGHPRPRLANTELAAAVGEAFGLSTSAILELARAWNSLEPAGGLTLVPTTDVPENYAGLPAFKLESQAPAAPQAISDATAARLEALCGTPPGSPFPVGATLGDGAFVVRQVEHSIAGQRLCLGEGQGSAVRVILAPPPDVSLEEFAARNVLAVEGVPPLLFLGPYASVEGLQGIALVEGRPGKSARELIRGPQAPERVGSWLRSLVGIALRLSERGQSLQGVRPETIDLEGNEIVSASPRAERCFMAAKASGNKVPAFSTYYLPPESLARSIVESAAGDVFVIALLAVEWLTGVHPFASDNLPEHLHLLMRGDRASIAPPVLRAALDALPAQRPTLQELEKALP
jgi:hypothetical protein